MKLHTKKHHSLAALLCLLALTSASCLYLNLESKLTPQYKEFYQQARYIMTTPEAKIFLQLPDSEKDNFIEDFWAKRDPSPDTEINELKEEYYNRVERAAELFHSEGKPGWMTDRGRIYILYGEPINVQTDPMGMSGARTCREIWYYGYFPVVFYDESCMGVYRLATFDFTPLRSRSIQYMFEINPAAAVEADLNPGQKRSFNFSGIVQNTRIENGKASGEVLIRIPVGGLWFKDQDGKLTADLLIELELRDAEGRTVWEHTQTETVRTLEEDLVEGEAKQKEIVIPFEIKGDVTALGQEKYRLIITATDLTGDTMMQKYIDFRF